MIDAQAFGAELAAIVKAATAPLIARLDALEKRLEAIPTPKEADPNAIADMVREQIKADVDALREAVEAIDIPGAPEIPDVAAMLAEAVPAAVAEAVAALPPAEPGKSVTVDDVAPMISGAVEKAVKAIPPAKDGIGLAGAMIDRGGNLVVTLTNGETKALGPVVGKDAEPALPGKDGLGFEDMEFITGEDGRPVAKFQRGEIVKSIALPCIIDRGPYRSGETYQKGDAVSYGGGLWIAQDVTSEKPDGGSGWRLAVKKGRDGKDGQIKAVK